MASDGAAARFPALGALAELLGEAGGDPPTGRELAELLWLARQMGDSGRPAAGRGPRIPFVPSATTVGAEKPHKPGPSRGDRPDERTAPDDPVPPAADRVPLHTPAGPALGPLCEPGPGHVSLLAPAPPMLAGPLALQRSLRPLRRTVPGTGGWELDEAATADRIAALGIAPQARPAPGRWWLPVLRPRHERWLHLRIVYDTGPTMPMWRPLVRELHTTFAQTGAFRTLDVVPLGPDGLLPARPVERGRTAVLVVSDAMGPQWRAGPAGLRWRDTLAGLGAELPVALLQPLPERLWRHSAAPPAPGRLASPAPGVPNTVLEFSPYDGGRAPAGVPVPVLEPSEVWLGNWAALVASPAGAEVPGAAAFVTPGAAPDPPDDALVPAEADPEELVLRFRSVASPQAFRLAAHLAVGSAHLPVLRLVQAAVERRPEPRHLAEVVLSGMLHADPGAAPGAYEFRPGVREVLLGALPHTSLVRTASLLARVSAEIESRAGALPGEFRALVADLEARRGERASGQPFALVSEESLRLLRGPERPVPAGAPPDGPAEGTEPGGRTDPAEGTDPAEDGPPPSLGDRYAIGERLGDGDSRVWRGHDRQLDRPVALTYHRFPSPAEPPKGLEDGGVVARFLARAQEAVGLQTGPHVVAVVDVVDLPTGCCVVTELVEGRSLRAYLDASGPLPVEEAVRIAQAVLDGLRTLHAAMGPHGDLTPAQVLGADTDLPRLRDLGLRRPDDRRTPDPDSSGLFPLEPGPGVQRQRGTARYLAPERQRTEPGPAGDLYSLGCVLFEMLTGTPPFPDADLATVLRHHAATDPSDARTLRPEVPHALQSIVHDLLSKNPAVREYGATTLAGLNGSPGGVEPVRVTYRLLGPPQASIRGEEATEASVRSAVLCRLLAARGLAVQEEELRAAVAGTAEADPAESARRLRELGHPIEVRQGSFRMPVMPGMLDLLRAEAFAEQADGALRLGDRATARSSLRSALSLWYGEPLGGVAGNWATQERERLRAWREELAGRLAELDGESPGDPGVLLVRRRRGTASARTTSLINTLDSLVRDRLGARSFGRVQPRSDGSIRASLAPDLDAVRLVEWAVKGFPDALAGQLEDDMDSPVRVDLVVHAGAEAAGVSLSGTGREPTAAEYEGARLIVTVLVSHGVRAQLPWDLRRRFDTVSEGARGWQHVVVVKRPGDPEPGGAPQPGRPWPSGWGEQGGPQPDAP
ncbi:SAV_2336 N-terminal domain-related protein [Streptomyces sp. NPDC051921]|uniref:SAV_2336 N-terminal domain-related protein n=1 Tax=Streptomyces sp. NPDC051921 TaxID=3155806 RepID=UPI00342EF92D